MTKESILTIFTDEYQREFPKLKDITLRNKLIMTSQLFCCSFEYELPKEKGIKRRVIRFIKRAVRKSTRFITAPYAAKNLKFQESVCELNGMMVERLQNLALAVATQSAKIKELEEALALIKSEKQI